MFVANVTKRKLMAKQFNYFMIQNNLKNFPLIAIMKILIKDNKNDMEMACHAWNFLAKYRFLKRIVIAFLALQI